MIWLFERGTERIQLTTRLDKTQGEYLIEIIWPDGRIESERYDRLTDFQTRLRALERRFESDHWTQASGSPKLIPEDWQGP